MADSYRQAIQTVFEDVIDYCQRGVGRLQRIVEEVEQNIEEVKKKLTTRRETKQLLRELHDLQEVRSNLLRAIGFLSWKPESFM